MEKLETFIMVGQAVASTIDACLRRKLFIEMGINSALRLAEFEGKLYISNQSIS